MLEGLGFKGLGFKGSEVKVCKRVYGVFIRVLYGLGV